MPCRFIADSDSGNYDLQYALFSSDPTIFEEAVKDAQWVQAIEEVNNEVAVIDEQHQDVNALQEKLKYIHVFFDKNFQCTDKDGNKKNDVETEEEDLHYVPETEEGSEEQLLSIKIQKTKKKNSKYTSRKKVKLNIF